MFSLGFEALQSEFECVKQLGVSQGAPPPPAQMLTPANSIREAIVTLYYSGLRNFPLSPVSNLSNTRTTHAHDASCRAVPVRIAHADWPCGAKMSEISPSSRTTTVESSMKSEHNLYLACEDSPQRAFFFCTFSCSLLALLASTVH